MTLTVLVVGSGAREHALVWACSRSEQVDEVLCAPGNGGTADLAENLAIAADDVDGIVRLAHQRAVDLVVIGPDAAIAAGLADACRSAGVPVFGPTAAAGRIESSKRFSKQLMDDAGIPTARWKAVTADRREEALEFIAELGRRCVVKADGLALGKGVTVCDTAIEAEVALHACWRDARFGVAGETVIIEERLEGREVSVFALSDGERVRLLGGACDYKRAFDGDRGPNTGGMGSYTPPAALDIGAFLTEVAGTVLQPCVDALRAQGTPYQGCLYAGIMLTDDGLRVLEFNARFGDPETQVILPMLADDLVPLMVDCSAGRLLPGRVACYPGACVGVVAASGNYPASSPSGRPIGGLDELPDDVLCFHAGTRRDSGGLARTSGGRVLSVVARGATLVSARERAYAGIERLSFEGMRFRRDIALRPAMDTSASVGMGSR